LAKEGGAIAPFALPWIRPWISFKFTDIKGDVEESFLRQELAAEFDIYYV